MTTPIFLTPLGLEAAAVRRGVRCAAIERIGMGPTKATAARARIAGSAPSSSPLILVGLGGGLTDGAVAGDVIVGTSVHLLDSEETIDLHDAERIAVALVGAGLNVHTGTIVSSPRVIRGAPARLAAAGRGAVVVDMESYWCASLTDTHSFSVCRILSDTPGQDLWSFRTPSAVLRALRVIGTVARTLHHLPGPIFESRSVEEADL
jgi:nucleoside phosphorylase